MVVEEPSLECSRPYDLTSRRSLFVAMGTRSRQSKDIQRKLNPDVRKVDWTYPRFPLSASQSGEIPRPAKLGKLLDILSAAR